MNKLRAPEFWGRPGLAGQLLEPLGRVHAAAGAARRALARPWHATVPVLCVGNVVAGGAGKTPVALDLATRLVRRGARPHLLSRGYGGSIAGPLAVDPARHGADEVGDEALLLARAAPSWVGADRVAGARAAIAAGARIIVMDDGFQNPALAKDLALLVIDGAYGFGNGRVMPAGPLREPIAAALARADALVVMGADEAGIAARLGGRRVLQARLVPAAPLAGPVIAFAGIGRPEKFFRTAAESGAQIVAQHAFPDHHRYGAAELARLGDEAERTGARLVTTAKDAVRLPPAWRERVSVIEIEIVWSDAAALDALLDRVTERAHD